MSTPKGDQAHLSEGPKLRLASGTLHRMASTFRADLVPTWVKVVAWTVPLTTLPSVIWRLVTSIGGLISGDDPCINPGQTSIGEAIWILAALPSGQLGLALLTIGLIRPWGEVIPQWIPVLGGRQVPVTFAATAATAGAVMLVVCVVGFVIMPILGLVEEKPLNPLPPGCSVPDWEVLRWYLPMTVWPPLLLVVTWHYVKRRRTPGTR